MNPKYLKYINTLFVVIPMTILMAFVGIARTYGFAEGLVLENATVMDCDDARGLHCSVLHHSGCEKTIR